MNLGDSLLTSAEREPAADALVEGSRRLTYTELLEQARSVAGGLEELGLGPDTRLAVALKNRMETVLLYWAAQWLGACFVPLNWRLKPDEINYCVEDAAATAVAYEGVSADAAATAPSGVRRIAVADGEGGLAFDELLTGHGPDQPSGVDERAPALMLYTSGTTGRPKGVPRAAAAERAAALAHVVQCSYRPGERTLGVMPLYHTMGMRSLLSMSLVGGCFVVQPDFRAADALAAIEAERISALYLAPTLYHDVVLSLAGRRDAVRSVDNIAYAGAPMSPTLVERCIEAFQPKLFVNHYGSTEIYTYAVHRDQAAKPGCAGRPGVNERLRVVAPEADAGPDDLVEPGEVGQIICHLSSDEAFSGYWRRPDADEKAIRDGWYFPGDLGRVDEDGDLYVIGRMDDMIISGGENVHPLELEDLLVRHPAVLEAAVVGLPDERFGQRVVAFVVAEEVSAEELDAHCRASTLASFKRPREYRMVGELPKNASGKILRRALRDNQTTTSKGPA
jgi:2-furoate---CoA ligase